MATEIDNLRKAIEDIAVLMPEVRDAGKSGEALLQALQEIQKQEAKTKERIDSIAASAATIEGKLQQVATSEEAFSRILEKIRDIRKNLDKKNNKSLTILAASTIVAFMIGSYTDFVNVKERGFAAIFKPGKTVVEGQKSVSLKDHEKVLMIAQKLKKENEQLKANGGGAGGFPFKFFTVDDSYVEVIVPGAWRVEVMGDLVGFVKNRN